MDTDDMAQFISSRIDLLHSGNTIPADVLSICKKIDAAGYEAWLVGGAIRDALLGREAHDWDIATDALPQAIVKLFPRVIETGIQHGTVTVLVNGQGYEVTTYRGDGAYSDGRHPDGVKFLKSIKEDLARRDFTINAIAYAPSNGAVCDPFDGMIDLQHNLIQAVGDPIKRFSEDGLRILRAARFSATLDFAVTHETLQAMRSSLATLAKVSVERVRDEWLKAMAAVQPSRAFNVMRHTGILNVVSPELVPMIGCSQNKYHAFDVWDHTMAVLDACPVEDPILRMAALLHDVSKPASKGVHEATGDATFYDHEIMGAEVADAIASRMKFSTKERERIVHLVRHHFVRYEPDWSDSAVRRWVKKVGLENVPSLLALARADIAGKGPAITKLDTAAISELEQRVSAMSLASALPTSTKSLAIDGKDVMERLQVKPGRVVGQVLAMLLEATLENPEVNTREGLLALVDMWSIRDD